MQLDIEHDRQVASTQHLAKYEGWFMTEGHSVQAMQLTAERPDKVFQDSPPKQPQRVWRVKSSPTQWSLTLMIGDGLLILGSLASLLMLAPYFHLKFHISWNEPGTWNSKFIWGCVALLSWSIAVRITHAQDLRSAANRFKSPLRALFALILMVIFWVVLI